MADGITAEIFIRNITWLTPLITYIIQADAITGLMPLTWVEGRVASNHYLQES